MRFSYRITYFICFLLSILFMASAFYLEYRLNIHPCLLCMLQRLVLALLIGLFFLGFIINWPRIIKIILTILVVLASLSGVLAALRQSWLQHMSSLDPNAVISCLPDPTFLLKHLPLSQVIKLTLTGTPECSQVDWTFMHLSLAEWSALLFVVFLVVGIRQFWQKK